MGFMGALGTWGPKQWGHEDLWDSGNGDVGDLGAQGIEAMGVLRIGDTGGLGTLGIGDMGTQTLQMWGLGHRGTWGT